jgi:hypothetical protein
MTDNEEFELIVYGREGSVSKTYLSSKDDAIRAAKDAAALEMTLNAEVFAYTRDINPRFVWRYQRNWCDVEVA